MLLRISVLLIFVGLMVGVTSSAKAEGDAQAGEVKTYTCLGCHGIEGYKNTYPTFRVPKLKGQHAKYIIAALKAYRSKERTHPTMRSQAVPMTDQDIEDIAAYISSLK